MPMTLAELLQEKFNPANVKQEDGRLFVYGVEVKPQPENAFHIYRGDECVHCARDEWEVVKFISYMPREYLSRRTK